VLVGFDQALVDVALVELGVALAVSAVSSANAVAVKAETRRPLLPACARALRAK
jgi:hypothetical protein